MDLKKESKQPGPLRLALPKGRMQNGVFQLLAEAGINLRSGQRDYRPAVSVAGMEAKILKPQSIIRMLHLGSRDLGFAGADWVLETKTPLVELLDTGLDPVRLVAAVPNVLLEDGVLPQRHLRIASEYPNLTKDWIKRRELEATFIPSYGATEVYPPEDADAIVDNTATGSTLHANNLIEIETILDSSTRLYAGPQAMEDPDRRSRIESFVLLVQSVLDARHRVMIEVNVSGPRLESVVKTLPCMREPTVSPLHDNGGFAVKAAVPREDLPELIPVLRRRGATDMVITNPSQIVL